MIMIEKVFFFLKMLYRLKDFDEKQKEAGRLPTALLLSSMCINEILFLFPSTASIIVLKELIFTKFKMRIWDSLIKYLVVVLVAQSCLTLCDPMACSPPSSSVLGILQARILEWIAIPFSRRSSWPRDQTWVSRIAGRLHSEPPGKPQAMARNKKFALGGPVWTGRYQEVLLRACPGLQTINRGIKKVQTEKKKKRNQCFQMWVPK